MGFHSRVERVRPTCVHLHSIRNDAPLNEALASLKITYRRTQSFRMVNNGDKTIDKYTHYTIIISFIEATVVLSASVHSINLGAFVGARHVFTMA